jgi:hypothetical protein
MKSGWLKTAIVPGGETRREAGAIEAVGTDTAVPWADARVRAILGPAADPGRIATSRGLIFAMDATASREPTWARALEVQASMFSAFAKGLRVQLVYFRGVEFFASRWRADAAELAAEMARVKCMGGVTQIGGVLAHAYASAERGGVSALVYVGDCMEEPRGELAALARKLGTRGVKAFMFQEGELQTAEASFREIAALTNGAYCRLGSGSSAELKELLAAAAAYAAGGASGLAQLAQHRPAARLLLTQLK